MRHHGNLSDLTLSSSNEWLKCCSGETRNIKLIDIVDSSKLASEFDYARAKKLDTKKWRDQMNNKNKHATVENVPPCGARTCSAEMVIIIEIAKILTPLLIYTN